MMLIQVGAEHQFDALVSDDDFLFLRNWSWTFARSHPGFNELIYARRGVLVEERIEGLRRTLPRRFDLFMHHVILARMGLPAPPVPGWTADHVNRNTLDNRRQNLRWASPSFQAKRQRHRQHPEFVAAALAAMLAEHTLPFVLEPPPLAATAGDAEFERIAA
jgi:hypothetical protein